MGLPDGIPPHQTYPEVALVRENDISGVDDAFATDTDAKLVMLPEPTEVTVP